MNSSHMINTTTSNKQFNHKFYFYFPQNPAPENTKTTRNANFLPKLKSLWKLVIKFRHLINSWVVNNFIGDPNLLIWKLFPRFISNLDSPLNAPAKTIRFRQFYGNIPPFILIPILLQSLYDVTWNFQNKISTQTTPQSENQNRRTQFTVKIPIESTWKTD